MTVIIAFPKPLSELFYLMYGILAYQPANPNVSVLLT